MHVRRIIAAAISTVALIAVNVGMADSAAAGARWDVQKPGDSTVSTFGARWD